MKKMIIGLVLTAVCAGIGVTAWAKTDDGIINNRTVQVTPSNVNNIKSEIESYINNKYGTNWAADLYAKNGEKWDDILEDELEAKFGHKYDDIIDNIIDIKEREAGLDKENDLDNKYDVDIDDKYDL